MGWFFEAAWRKINQLKAGVTSVEKTELKPFSVVKRSLLSSAPSGGPCYDGAVVSNSSPALPHSLPACSALLAGENLTACPSFIHSYIPAGWRSATTQSISWRLLCLQAIVQTRLGTQGPKAVGQCRGFLTTAYVEQNRTLWKQTEKYTIKPMGMKKTGGRDRSGKDCPRNVEEQKR